MQSIHVSMCEGCCCGHPEKGNPKVMLKEFEEMLQEANLPNVSFLVPYCLGPCGMANVVRVETENSYYWFGRMNKKDDIGALLEFLKNPSALPARLAKRQFML